MTVPDERIGPDGKIGCDDCGIVLTEGARWVFRNAVRAPGGRWWSLCAQCSDGAEAVSLAPAALTGDVEPFTCVARPLANEVAFLFGDGFVVLTAAEARQIHAKLGDALTILDGAHAVQRADAQQGAA